MIKNKKEQTAKEIEKMQIECNDKNCPIHGMLKSRGRFFEGIVIKKLNKRITIILERTVYIRKFERYKKTRTKIHARLPNCLDKDINVGDLVKIQECRPLSKIIHFVFVEKIKGREDHKAGLLLNTLTAHKDKLEIKNKKMENKKE